MRLGVVLLVPEPVASAVDGLRRAFSDPALDQVAPHVTLVPPVNVRGEDLAAGLAVLRDAAASVESLDLVLGPVTAFPGGEGVAYLEVRGDDEVMAELRALRSAVFRPPFERQVDHDFVPHVTLTQGVDAARLEAVRSAAAGWDGVAVRVGVLHLLEERRGDGTKRWTPIADVPLGARVVVGRGGLELELTAGGLLDPEAATARDGDGDADRVIPPPGARSLVVVARREHHVVGLAQGWTAPAGDRVLVDCWVAPDQLDDVDGHLRAAWQDAAARRLH